MIPFFIRHHGKSRWNCSLLHQCRLGAILERDLIELMTQQARMKVRRRWCWGRRWSAWCARSCAPLSTPSRASSASSTTNWTTARSFSSTCRRCATAPRWRPATPSSSSSSPTSAPANRRPATSRKCESNRPYFLILCYEQSKPFLWCSLNHERFCFIFTWAYKWVERMEKLVLDIEHKKGNEMKLHTWSNNAISFQWNMWTKKRKESNKNRSQREKLAPFHWTKQSKRYMKSSR